MINDEELKKLKMEYKNITPPANGRMEIEKIIESAKADKQKADKKIIFIKWLIAAAAVLTIIILPNTSQTMAFSMQNLPIVGKLFSVVTIRDYKYDDGNNSIDIKSAKIDSAGDKVNESAVRELNNDIRKYTDKIVKQFKKDMSSSGYSSLNMNYEKITDTDKWFTIVFNITETRASAYEFHRYYNIDKTKGKIVALKDIFKEHSEYIDIISNEIKRQMDEQMKNGDIVYFTRDNGVSNGFKQISENANYYFNSDGNLVICFDEYEVGPGYIGSPQFIIPKNVTEKILN